MNKDDESIGDSGILNEPGITVYHSQTSAAFMLITFMVGDLLLVYKTLSSPVSLEFYAGLDDKKFIELKNKVLKNQASGEFSHLNLQESISMYLLVDLVCKCFVDEANETLKELAIENVKVSETEYEQLRINFLRYGQSLVEKMNEKFEKNEFFCGAVAKLKAS